MERTPTASRETFAGEFTKPVEDVVGDDNKLQRTYKLTFTQSEPADASEQWQFSFNQQEKQSLSAGS